MDGQLIETFQVQVGRSEQPDSSTQEEVSSIKPDDSYQSYIPHSENFGRINSQAEFTCGSNKNEPVVEWIRLDGGRVSV